jgi:hypothetical protein
LASVVTMVMEQQKAGITDDAVQLLCNDIAGIVGATPAGGGGSNADGADINQQQLQHMQQRAAAQEMESTVQTMLVRLDEYAALASALKNSTSESKQCVPALLERAADLEQLYLRIDELELYLRRVSQKLGAMEDAVGAAQHLVDGANRDSSSSSFRSDVDAAKTKIVALVQRAVAGSSSFSSSASSVSLSSSSSSSESSSSSSSSASPSPSPS